MQNIFQSCICNVRAPAVGYDALEERALHLAVEEGVPDPVVRVVRREQQRQRGRT